MRILILLALLVVAVVSTAVALPENYARSIANLLISEGGYSNDRSDPGGPTNFGITIYDYRKYAKPGATAAEVRAMPKSVALEIYRTKYWAAMRGDELCSGLDYSVFDYAVNSGLSRAGKVLRRTLALPSAEWHVTDQVIMKMRTRDCADLVTAVNTERLAFLKSLHTWPVFGKGWGRRVVSVRAISLQMAGVSQGLLSTDLVPARSHGKAYEPDDDSDTPEMMP